MRIVGVLRVLNRLHPLQPPPIFPISSFSSRVFKFAGSSGRSLKARRLSRSLLPAARASRGPKTDRESCARRNLETRERGGCSHESNRGSPISLDDHAADRSGLHGGACSADPGSACQPAGWAASASRASLPRNVPAANRTAYKAAPAQGSPTGRGGAGCPVAGSPWSGLGTLAVRAEPSPGVVAHARHPRAGQLRDTRFVPCTGVALCGTCRVDRRWRDRNTGRLSGLSVARRQP